MHVTLSAFKKLSLQCSWEVCRVCTGGWQSGWNMWTITSDSVSGIVHCCWSCCRCSPSLRWPPGDWTSPWKDRMSSWVRYLIYTVAYAYIHVDGPSRTP